MSLVVSLGFLGLNIIGVSIPSETLPFMLLSGPAHRRFPINYLFGSAQFTLPESFYYSLGFVCLEVVLTLICAFWLIRVGGRKLHDFAVGLDQRPVAVADSSLPWHRFLFEEGKLHCIYLITQLSHFIQRWHSRGGWWSPIVIVFAGFMTGCLKYGIYFVIMSGRLIDFLFLMFGVTLKLLLVCYSVSFVNKLLDKQLTWYVAIALFLALNVFFFIKRHREVRRLTSQYSQP